MIYPALIGINVLQQDAQSKDEAHRNSAFAAAAALGEEAMLALLSPIDPQTAIAAFRKLLPAAERMEALQSQGAIHLGCKTALPSFACGRHACMEIITVITEPQKLPPSQNHALCICMLFNCLLPEVSESFAIGGLLTSWQP